jgi:outer membrane protein OmpA-like peptidoglycan-associated protein
MSFVRSLDSTELDRIGEKTMNILVKLHRTSIDASGNSWVPTVMANGVFALVVLAASSCLPAAAQQVLQGQEITESALVEALTPPPAPILTRSLNAAPAVAPKPAKAALLITFETNATALTTGAKRELDIVGRALNTSKLADFNFVIEGHADPRGSAEGNRRLSEGRAAAVREYLVQNQSVREDRLKAVGKGDREPLNANNPAAPENRRVVFVNMSN